MTKCFVKISEELLRITSHCRKSAGKVSIIRHCVYLLTVNLLSHYYLDHRHSSLYFKMGLLLPDLLSSFNQKLRKSVFAYVTGEQEYCDLREGIQKHYAVDAVFHNSQEFSFFCELIGRELDAHRFPSFQKRRYFMAHVFLEKLLDRVLVKQSPTLSVKLHRDLEAVEAGVLASYFSRIGKPAIQHEFFSNFNRLHSGILLHYYSDNEMFGKALVRVYQRINPVQPDPEETANLAHIADAVENNHRESLLGIFETVNYGLEACARTNQCL